MERSLEEACRMSETYDFRRDLEVGDFLDMHDKAKWRVAQVKKVSETAVDAHYEGWTPRYDEQGLAKSSARVAPFRYFSAGYTGQVHNTYRDFKYLKADKDTLAQKLTSIMGLDRKLKLTPKAFNRLVRGELFVYVDSLMSLLHYGKPNIEEVQDIFAFMGTVFEFVLKWIQAFPAYRTEFEAVRKYDKLYLVDLGAAIAMAFPEMAEILKISFGSDGARCGKSFLYVEQLMTSSTGVDKAAEDRGTKWCVEQFFNLFKNFQGLEVLSKIVDAADPTTGEYLYPISVIIRFLAPFLTVLGDEELKTKLLAPASEGLSRRFADYRKRDVEDVDKFGISEFFYIAESIMKQAGVSPFQMRKNIENWVYRGYLQSEDYRDRLRGMALLRDRLGIGLLVRDYRQAQRDKLEQAAITITNMSLIEVIFSGAPNAPHSALITAAKDFVKLVILSQKFTEGHLRLVWSCYESAPPDARTAILDLVADIAEYAHYPILEQFHKLIKSIPITAYTLEMVKFISLYMLNIKKNIAGRKADAARVIAAIKKENEQRVMQNQPIKEIPKELYEENYELYDYDLLWSLLIAKQDTKLDLAVKEQAMDCLITNIAPLPELIQNYLIKAIYCIASNNEALLRLMKFLIRVTQIYETKHGVKNTLKEINSTHSLFSHIFMLFMKYKGIANDQAQKQGVKSVMAHVFQGGYTHEEYIRGYFEFLEHIIVHTSHEAALSVEQIGQLWSHFVTHSTCREERDLFFSYIARTREEAKTGKRTYTLVNDSNCIELVSNFFVKPDKFKVVQITPPIYYCYKSLMIRYNILKKSIKEEKGSLVALNDGVEGILTLWKIAFECTAAAPRNDAIQLIVDLYYSLYKEKKAPLALIASSYLRIGLSQVNPKSQSRIRIFLKLVKRFLIKFDDYRCYKVNRREYKIEPTATRKCTALRSDGTVIKEWLAKIRESMNVLDLRKLLSYNLKVPISRIKLMTAGKRVVEESQNLVTMKNAKVDFVAEVKKQSLSADQCPSHIFGNSPNVFESLVELMEVDEVCAGKMWGLYRTFPTSSAILEPLLVLGFSGEVTLDSWYKLLKISNRLPALIYTVYAIKRVLNSTKALEFVPVFLAKRGGLFLVHHYLDYLSKHCPVQSPIKLKLIRYIQQCLTSLFHHIQHSDKIFESKTLKEEFVKETLKLLGDLMNVDPSNDSLYQCSVKTIKQSFGVIHEFGTAFQQNAVDLLEADNAFYNLLSRYFKQCASQKLMRCVTKSVRSHLSQARGLNYTRYLAEQIMYKPFDEKDSLNKLTKHYFVLVCNLLEACSEEVVAVEKLKAKGVHNSVSDILCNYWKYPGVHFRGLINLYEVIYRKFKTQLGGTIGDKRELISTLLLFIFPFSGGLEAAQTEVMKEVVSDQMILGSALGLLHTMCVGDLDGVYEVSQFIHPCLVKLASWRTSKPLDWALVVQESREVATSQHVGLENPVNVCYMNSLLQQLHSTRALRLGVLDVEVPSDNLETNLLYRLKLVFGTLQKEEYPTYDATHLCAIVKDFEGITLSVNEQKDVDEFFNLLCDRMEAGLRNTAYKSLIQDVYGGAFANEIICMDCPHRSENVENFLALNLQIFGKSKMEESLKALVESESLEGGNMYYCDRCEKKMRAKRRSSLKILPNVLVVALKRFEYNLETNAKKKINDYYEFPLEVDMEPYSEEFNLKKDIMEKLDAQEAALNEDELKMARLDYPKDYYAYQLKGVVLHMGTGESGHYTSLIRDPDNKWFEYNDSMVREFSIDRLADEAFGGHEEAKGILSSLDGKHEMFARIKNAYMLVYERRAHFNMHVLQYLNGEGRFAMSPEEFRKEFDSARMDFGVLEKRGLTPDIEAKIVEEQARDRVKKTILNSSFIHFIQTVIERFSVPAPGEYKALKKLENVEGVCAKYPEYGKALRISQFLYQYIFTVYLRIKEESRPNTYSILRLLKKQLRSDPVLSTWIVEYLSHPQILLEFFIACPSTSTRVFVGSLLCSACRSVYDAGEKLKMRKIIGSPEEFHRYCLKRGEETVMDTGKKCIALRSNHRVPSILLMLNNVIQLFPQVLSNHLLLYDLSFFVCNLLKIGPELRKFLLINNFTGVIFEKLFELSNIFVEACEKTAPIVCVNPRLDPAVPEIGRDRPRPPKMQDAIKQAAVQTRQLKYLLSILSQLFSECSLIAPSPYSTAIEGLLPHKLDLTESEFLSYFFEDQFLKKLFGYVSTSVAREAVARIVCHLCYQNTELSIKLIQFLIISISRSSLPQMPDYIPALESLVVLEDGCKEEKLKTFIQYFKELTLKVFNESYLAMNYMVDLFISLSLKCPAFGRITNEDPTKFAHIRKWLDSNTVPNPKSMSWLKTSYKSVPVGKELDSKEKALCKEYSAKRIKLIKLLEAKRKPDAEPILFQSEEFVGLFGADFSEEKVRRKKFDLRVKGEWVAAEVEESAEEVVQLSYQLPAEPKQFKWIRKGSDRLSYPGTYTALDACVLYTKLRKRAILTTDI